jgi:ABC-type branched-subunit amino acid transport system ATPase component
VLEGAGISQRFGGLAALTDVSFHVEAGEIVASSAPTAPAGPRCSTPSMETIMGAAKMRAA